MSREALWMQSSDLDGKSFATSAGAAFRVTKGDYFPAEAVGKQHRTYLRDLEPGLLVSVSFHGQPVPVVKVAGGVVRLVTIEIDGTPKKGARDICALLGIMETRQPVDLQTV